MILKDITYSEYLAENIKNSLKYSDYLAKNLDKAIDYSAYIAENIDKINDYAEYIAENLDPISFSEYRINKKYKNFISDNLDSSMAYLRRKLPIISEEFEIKEFIEEKVVERRDMLQEDFSILQ